jgi:DNA topoisomerase-3
MAEARKATHLVIWTDCDREGEHIGSEVAEVCRKANPRIIVKRARFSAIIAKWVSPDPPWLFVADVTPDSQVNHAARNPVDLDMLQANAVWARMDLDLRTGAVLTRVQTLGLQARIPALADSMISYGMSSLDRSQRRHWPVSAGSCQFPTLGFVVDQYERVQAFVAEPFWSIKVSLAKDDDSVPFTWRRGRLFDEAIVEMLHALCEEEPEATVIRQQTKPTQKWWVAMLR